MKKRLSLFVAMVMLLTSMIPALTVNAAFSDVEDSNPYKKSITTLSTLEVINGYEDGTFAPDKEISRAEFTKMIVYMLNLGQLSTPITQFTDVPSDHWANANIKTAYDLGIINGFDDVTFQPDSPVTYEQALKMVVCTLGYQGYAEAAGGYPNGYRAQGEALKLTSGVKNIGYTDNAPRGVIAQIMYNALEVEMYEMVNYKWQKTGKTLLNDYLNVEKLKGTVVGVGDSTTADCSSKLAQRHMAIDEYSTGKEYVIDFTDYDAPISTMTSYLGQTVTAYYRSANLSDDMKLIAIDGESAKNKEINITSYDIEDYSDGLIKYETADGKSAKLNLDLGEVSLRYNGRAVGNNTTIDGHTYSVAGLLEKWLDPNSEDYFYGTVKFVSNDSSSSYNMVDIYDYGTIVAYKTPSSTDYKITDKLETGKSITLDPEDVYFDFSLTRNNDEITTTQIKANEVINYAYSLDGTYCKAISNDKKVTGKITSVKLTSTNPTISIDKVEYPISQRFINYIQNKENKELTSGLQITAYPDALGTLEWGTISSSESFYQYAYVINAVSDGEDYYLKLFAPSNVTATSFTATTSYKVKSYKIASSGSRLNGKRTSAESIVDALEESAETTNPGENFTGEGLTGYNQFVRVKFSATGEIEDVVTNTVTETPKENSDNATLIRYSSVDPSKKYDVTSTSVKSGNSTLYSIKSTTPVFIIPADRTDSEGYVLKKALTNGSIINGGEYYLEAYDVSSARYPSCVAVYGSGLSGGTPISYDTIVSLVGAENERDGDEDGTFYWMNTYNSNTTLSRTRISDSPEENFNTLNVGDVIRYGLDKDNRANDYDVIIAYADILDVLESEDYDWSALQFEDTAGNYRVHAGMYNVIQVLGDSEDEGTEKLLRISADNTSGDDYEEIKYTDSTQIVKYDSATEEFIPYTEVNGNTKLKITDLREAVIDGSDCSKVLIVYRGLSSSTPSAKFIVIYE